MGPLGMFQGLHAYFAFLILISPSGQRSKDAVQAAAPSRLCVILCYRSSTEEEGYVQACPWLSKSRWQVFASLNVKSSYAS